MFHRQCSCQPSFFFRVINVYYLLAFVVSRIWLTFVVVMRCLIILYFLLQKMSWSSFSIQRTKFFEAQDCVGNKVINFCDSVTYHGVKISANLSDDDIFRLVRAL